MRAEGGGVGRGGPARQRQTDAPDTERRGTHRRAGGVGIGIRTAPNPPIGAGKHTPQGEGPGGTGPAPGGAGGGPHRSGDCGDVVRESSYGMAWVVVNDPLSEDTADDFSCEIG